jgi:predicted ATPase
LQALHTALEIMESTGDRHYAVETYRMRGVLLLRQGTPSATGEAEAAFGKALRIAREQHATSFALRVAISWGGHLVETNRRDDARRLLGRIYDGFTEGSGTLDHQEAQALLQRVR